MASLGKKFNVKKGLGRNGLSNGKNRNGPYQALPPRRQAPPLSSSTEKLEELKAKQTLNRTHRFHTINTHSQRRWKTMLFRIFHD